jgi:hypothetical protein
MRKINHARSIAEIGAEPERDEQLARGLLRRLTGREGVVGMALEPGREQAERVVGVEVPLDGARAGSRLAKRVLCTALSARHDLAVSQHALAREDRGELGFLAQH